MKSVRRMLDWIGYNLRSPALIKATDYERICEMAHAIEAEVESEYVKFPVDRDGEPIRVGDMVQLRDSEPFEVGGIRVTRSQWHIYPYDLQRWYSPLDLTHYIKPTIEDILREFAEGVEGQNNDFKELIVAEYADKLREVMGDD